MEEINKDKIYTKQEADELVDKLKVVFNVVRILEGTEVSGFTAIKGSMDNCRCFEFWGKNKPCINCISIKTLKDKNDRTKIEMLDDQLFQIFAKYINVEGQDCVLECLKNITYLDIEPDDLRHLSEDFLNLDNKLYKDPLTGCFNRLYYDERLRKTLDNTAVVFIDMDGLKDMNDVYGHSFGDTCLKAIAEVLLKNVRSDDSVIRFGGDEFILMLPNITKSSLTPKLERIRKAVYDLILPEHDKVRLSVSIGAVICNGDTLEGATKRADKLMYTAKSTKNCVVTEWGGLEEEVGEVSDVNKLYLLIVDDSDINRFLLKSMLESKYKILEAKDGKEAIKVIEDYRKSISLILLDIEMPNMGGFEYLTYLKNNNYLNDIPVIMISSDNNEDVILRSYELGALDYITRPYNAKIVEQRVANLIKLFLRQRNFKHEIREQINRLDADAKMMSVIYSYAIEYRNKETGIHIIHVQRITEILLNELCRISNDYNFTDEQKKNIVNAAAMHDIGKLGVKQALLNNTSNLSSKEKEEMRAHTTIGADILDSMDLYKDDDLVKYAHNICRWHHERYDGTGYPDGLKGDEIPIEAQIVSLANCYDHLLSKKDKKDEKSYEEVVNEIETGKDGYFNPLLVRCLANTKDAIKKIYLTK